MIWAKTVGVVFIGRSLECERAPIIQKRVQIDYDQKMPYLFHYVHNGKHFKCNVGTLLFSHI